MDSPPRIDPDYTLRVSTDPFMITPITSRSLCHVTPPSRALTTFLSSSGPQPWWGYCLRVPSNSSQFTELGVGTSPKPVSSEFFQERWPWAPHVSMAT